MCDQKPSVDDYKATREYIEEQLKVLEVYRVVLVGYHYQFVSARQ